MPVLSKDFSKWKIFRDKEGHYTVIKESFIQKVIIIFNVYASNNKASKYKKQNCKEIDESTITTGDFNTPFSEIAFQVALGAKTCLTM